MKPLKRHDTLASRLGEGWSASTLASWETRYKPTGWAADRPLEENYRKLGVYLKRGAPADLAMIEVALVEGIAFEPALSEALAGLIPRDDQLSAPGVIREVLDDSKVTTLLEPAAAAEVRPVNHGERLNFDPVSRESASVDLEAEEFDAFREAVIQIPVQKLLENPIEPEDLRPIEAVSEDRANRVDPHFLPPDDWSEGVVDKVPSLAQARSWVIESSPDAKVRAIKLAAHFDDIMQLLMRHGRDVRGKERRLLEIGKLAPQCGIHEALIAAIVAFCADPTITNQLGSTRVGIGSDFPIPLAPPPPTT